MIVDRAAQNERGSEYSIQTQEATNKEQSQAAKKTVTYIGLQSK